MSTQNSWKKEQELRLDNQCHEHGLAEKEEGKDAHLLTNWLDSKELCAARLLLVSH